MEQKVSDPFEVRCNTCGAPAEFDIVQQVYHCRYCGSDVNAKNAHAKAYDWQEIRRKELASDQEKVEKEIHVCKNCGARVIIPSGEAGGVCEFCGGNLVRGAFTENENMPDVIIPFFLTEAEAKARLKEWADKNKDTKEGRWVSSNINRLKGYYLPYQIVKGPIRCVVSRDQAYSEQKYNCGSFVQRLAVNTSKQLDNLVLDGAEPFDWQGLKPFEFGYITGQNVKLPDISGNEAANRVLREIEEDYRPTVERVMETSGIQLHAQSDSLLSLPALLPVYLFVQGKKMAVVNGQTGRVAVSAGRVKKTYPWVIEPAIMTILAAVMMHLLFWDWELTGMGTIVFGLIFFVGFSNGRGAKIKNMILKGENSRAEREGIRLVMNTDKDLEEKEIEEPVFFETVGGVLRPVKITFSSMARIVVALCSIVVFIGLPDIIAAVCVLLGVEELRNIEWLGSAAWMVLTVPISFILWMSVFRIRLYDHPIVKLIEPDGKLRSVAVDGMKGENAFTPVLEMLGMMPWWALLIIAIILLGSTLAMFP